jgi:predicted N-acetyltransferase YhbS
MDTLSITAATATDVEPLAAMRAAVSRDMERRFGPGGWSAIASKAEVLKQLRASRVLVARLDDRIVGTVRLTIARTALFDASAFTPVATAVYLLGMAVAPEAQGRRVGARLLEAAKAAARAWPADAVWLDTDDHAAGAGSYYRARGFTEVGRMQLADRSLILFEHRLV